jgi:hypothetical protein
MKVVKGKATPWFFGGVGAMFLFFFAIGMVAQISTTEATLLGGSADLFKPNWGVLLQLPRLVGILGPALDGKESAAVFLSWFISLVYVGCVAGNEIYDDVKTGKGILFTNLFRVGIFLMVAFNFWTDLQYGHAIFDGDAGAIGFAVVVGFVVAFSGVIGVDFLEKAWKKM